jgi:hypothetical protein
MRLSDKGLRALRHMDRKGQICEAPGHLLSSVQELVNFGFAERQPETRVFERGQWFPIIYSTITDAGRAALKESDHE